MDDILVVGVLQDLPGAVKILEEGLNRDGPAAKRGPLRQSAINSAFRGNGRVIAVFHNEVIVAWAQLANIDLLYGPSFVELCRYWGDDHYIASNMFKVLLTEACHVALDEWDAIQLNCTVWQETILPSFMHMGSRILRDEEGKVWYIWTATVGSSPVDEQLVFDDEPKLPHILDRARCFRFVRS